MHGGPSSKTLIYSHQRGNSHLGVQRH